MELDVSFMSSVLSLYNELITNGISVVYIGKFNHQITKMFTAMYEEEMEKNSENKKTKRKVYHTLVELLQNMQKHSNQIIETYNLGSGLFMIGKTDEIYYIITSNKVQRKDIESITEALEVVNKCTKEELKEMHKKQLKEGKISIKGGAGFGLIDIARKTGGKLDYLFLQIEGEDYFVLKVEINAQNIDDDEEVEELLD
jgi:hypothetical protein